MSNRNGGQFFTNWLLVIMYITLLWVAALIYDMRAQYVCNEIHPSWTLVREFPAHECKPPNKEND